MIPMLEDVQVGKILKTQERNEEMKQDNQDKIDMLLDLLEHPENYTESQKNALFEDAEVRELYQQMVETREAFDYQKSKEEMAMPSVSDEWEKLKAKKQAKKITLWPPMRKVAAVAAILVVSGIAFAAIHLASRSHHDAASSQPQQAIEQQDSVRPSSAPATTQQTAAADTTASAKLPLLYENAELQNILTPIAEHFHVSVSYQNESARHIRLYLQLTENMNLDEIVELMNHFEKVNIRHEGNVLIVE